MAACDLHGCTHGAMFRPVIVIELPPRTPDGRPGLARAKLERNVCAPHRLVMGVADFLSLEGWRDLCTGFATARLTTPDRSRVTLEWEPLPEAPAP